MDTHKYIYGVHICGVHIRSIQDSIPKWVHENKAVSGGGSREKYNGCLRRILRAKDIAVCCGRQRGAVFRIGSGVGGDTVSATTTSLYGQPVHLLRGSHFDVPTQRTP